MRAFLAIALFLQVLCAACATRTPLGPLYDCSAESQLTQELGANTDYMLALAYLRSGDSEAAIRYLEKSMYGTVVLAEALVREPPERGHEISSRLRSTALCHLHRIRAYREAYPPHDADWPLRDMVEEALANLPADPVEGRCGKPLAIE